jgi:hypothetical protein
MTENIEPIRAADARRFEARLATDDRSPLMVATLVAAFVALAILKPWAAAGSPETRSVANDANQGAGIAPVDPRSSGLARRTPTGDAIAEMCLEPGSWRTATIETWNERTVRVWRAIDPAPASRPLDASIPIVPAVGTSIPAIGYCAPTSGPEQPLGPATIQAWWVDGDAVERLELRQITPRSGVSPYGALFGPPAELGSTTSWPNGLVVFRYEEGGAGAGASRWFGIQVSGTTEDGQPVIAP